MKKRLFYLATCFLLAAALIVTAKLLFFTVDAAKKSLAEQSTIRRDTFGVPHILAETEEAAEWIR